MGHGMARNLLKNGYEVTLMVHRNRKPIEDLLGQGAKEAKNPREVAVRLKKMLGGNLEVAVVDINDIGGNILGSTLDKAGERRLVQILGDNPLGQATQSTPMGIVREV